MTILGITLESSKQKREREYCEYVQLREEQNKIAQVRDDAEWERTLIRGAQNRFTEWMYAKSWLVHYGSFIGIRDTHDDKYSRWSNAEDSKNYLCAHFEKLKEDAISKAEYPEWFEPMVEKFKNENSARDVIGTEWLLWYGAGSTLNNAQRELVNRKHFK